MYGCESWTIKKTECWKTDAFILWCWGRLLRVPWTVRRSNQLILKEISPEYSLEGLMLKLKLQYFGHLMWRADSLEKTLILGKIEGRRRRGQQKMRWFEGINDPIWANDTRLSKLWETVKDREAWCATVHGSQGGGHNWVTKELLPHTRRPGEGSPEQFSNVEETMVAHSVQHPYCASGRQQPQEEGLAEVTQRVSSSASSLTRWWGRCPSAAAIHAPYHCLLLHPVSWPGKMLLTFTKEWVTDRHPLLTIFMF